MIQLTRRAAIAAFSVIALTACGGADTSNAQEGTPGSSELALTDIALGDADAPITIVEYASWTCPACLQFHTDVIPVLKSEYIETGKAKLVFREFPTPPANLAGACTWWGSKVRALQHLQRPPDPHTATL